MIYKKGHFNIADKQKEIPIIADAIKWWCWRAIMLQRNDQTSMIEEFILLDFFVDLKKV